jgi:hypothetical protein
VSPSSRSDRTVSRKSGRPRGLQPGTQGQGERGPVIAPAPSMSTTRRILVLALALVVFAGPEAEAQVPDTLVETLRAAVDEGDVNQLVALGEERIEVGLFGAARLYSRSQARRVLLRFFRDNPPTRLTIRESVATDKAWFASGDYHRLGGREPLRVFIRLRKVGDAWQLREFVVLEASGL